MTGLDDDNRELDDFLARRSVLHRRLADRDYHEPSQELDRLVLDEAREAIEVPAGAPMYRAPRWALPVALAASVVLALAVVLNFARMRGPELRLATSASPAADAAPGFADRQALPVAPPAPAVELAKQNAGSFAPEPRTDSADADTSPLQASNGAAKPEAQAAESDRASDALLASNAPVSAPLSAMSREAERTASQTAAKSQARAAVQMPAEVHAAADASAVAGAAAGSVQSAIPPPPASNSPRFARAEATSERRVVPARDVALRQAGADTGEQAVAKRERKESATAAAAAEPAPEDAASSDKASHTNPQVWMREIEQLRLAGKSVDADREIAAFRKAFPSLPVSPAALGRDPRPTK